MISGKTVRKDIWKVFVPSSLEAAQLRTAMIEGNHVWKQQPLTIMGCLQAVIRKVKETGVEAVAARRKKMAEERVKENGRKMRIMFKVNEQGGSYAITLPEMKEQLEVEGELERLEKTENPRGVVYYAVFKHGDEMLEALKAGQWSLTQYRQAVWEEKREWGVIIKGRG